MTDQLLNPLVLLSLLSAIAILVAGTLPASWFIGGGTGLLGEEKNKKLRRSGIWQAMCVAVVVIAVVGIIGYYVWSQYGDSYFIYFALMVLGVLAEWVWTGVQNRKNGIPVIDIYDLAPPLVISPLVFSIILQKIAKEPHFDLGIFAFQNGFFWKTVFSKLKKS